MASNQLHPLDHHSNYAHTMQSLHRHLSPGRVAFSKFIHAPLVESVSEFLAATVGRPSVLLGAALTGLIIGLVFYTMARLYGYALSGSEIIFSLPAGAVLGLVVEGLYRLFKRR